MCPNHPAAASPSAEERREDNSTVTQINRLLLVVVLVFEGVQVPLIMDDLRLRARDTSVHICFWGDSRDRDYYLPENAHELGWIIGKNTNLKELHLHLNPFEGLNNNAIDTFCRGVNSNRSIQKISFGNMDLSGGEIEEMFQSLSPFFMSNNNLSDVEVGHCQFGAGCAHQLSSAFRGSKSLKYVSLINNQMGGEQLVEIIGALSAHYQLERLRLPYMNIGRNECTALANLLRSTATQRNECSDLAHKCGTTTMLHTLKLNNNRIDDEGVDATAGALANSRLQHLNLSSNRVTARGCQSLTALLEDPGCNLEQLDLENNNIGDEGALIFANALASNRKLKTLNLCDNGITAEGWSSFSKVLCDTSSINNTFLSNHKLESLVRYQGRNLPPYVSASLALNRSNEDKNQVAIKKILKHHQYFGMRPFFNLDLKVLPIAINWFEKARSVDSNDVAGVDKRKLDAIYQFIRAMPEVFEPAPAAGEKRKVQTKMTAQTKPSKSKRSRSQTKVSPSPGVNNSDDIGGNSSRAARASSVSAGVISGQTRTSAAVDTIIVEGAGISRVNGIYRRIEGMCSGNAPVYRKDDLGTEVEIGFLWIYRYEFVACLKGAIWFIGAGSGMFPAKMRLYTTHLINADVLLPVNCEWLAFGSGVPPAPQIQFGTPSNDNDKEVP